MHTYVRLRGFGLTVVPFAPYVVRRLGDGSDGRIGIEHDGRLAILDPALSAIADEVSSVADVGTCEYSGDWLMDFGDFTVRWPNRWALGSSDLNGVPFEWWGNDGASVMWQGPFSRVPSDEDLAAPGQTLADAGAADGIRWAEFSYDLDGVAWAQRHTMLPGGYVVTAQSPLTARTAAWAVADALAQDARPGLSH